MERDDLYGLPLDRFVPERGALAKALRAEGRREEATDVAGMRKPSVAAWAVNQVVRTQGRAMKALFEAGDALRDAQVELLAGRGDGRALRAARGHELAAVDRLVDAARGLLTSEGHELGAAVVDRVADTLHAAALDEDAREQVREGRLERELRHVGFGLGDATATATAPAPAPAPRAAKRKAQPKEAGAGKRAVKKRPAAERAEAERAKRERTAARKAARAAEAAARRGAQRAARALATAEERRERAAQALGEADQALAAAREEAEAAVAEHRRAEVDLEKK